MGSQVLASSVAFAWELTRKGLMGTTKRPTEIKRSQGIYPFVPLGATSQARESFDTR